MSSNLPFPIYGAEYRVVFPIFDNDGDLVVSAAGLDSEVSKDAGAFADCANEATQIATNSGMYYLDLTYQEMQAGIVAVIVKTSTTDAKTTPLVLYPRRLPAIRSGTAQAGAAGSITLDGSASFDDDHYVGLYALITGNTGAGQIRLITGYNGTTKVANVAPDWSTNPDNSSTFEILIPENAMVSGWTGVPVGAPNASGDLIVDVWSWRGQAVPAAHTNGYPIVTIKDGTGTGEIDTDAGAVPIYGGSIDTVNDKTGYSLSSAGIQAIWDALTSALTTAGSIGTLLVDNINATISSRSSHSAADVRTEMDANSTQLAAIVADTNELQTDWTDGGRLDLIADAVLSDTDALETRLTATRAGYLDNLNVGGNVASSAEVTAILNRLGGWSGSGANTILGALRALFRSDADAAVPADINADLGGGAGTADNTTESLQALQAEHDATQAAVAALNNPSLGDINAEVDAALADIMLDHLMATALPGGVSDMHLNSALGELLDNGTTWTYDRASDSQEALADAVDSVDLGVGSNTTLIGEALERIGDFGAANGNTIKGFLQALFRSDAGVTGLNIPGEINETENGTAGTYDPATESLQALQAEHDATQANQTTILNRIGGFAGSGLNTVKGFLQAMARSDAGVADPNTPSEINEFVNGTAGTYNAATDSLQAQQDGTPAAVAGAVWDEARSGHTTAGTFGEGVLVQTNNDKTGYALTSGERVSIADAILTRDWAAVTGEAARSILNALRFLRNRKAVSGGATLIVYEEDDSTIAWTGSVVSDAAADPIIEVDPS